jgi:hypothetical protein
LKRLSAYNKKRKILASWMEFQGSNDLMEYLLGRAIEGRDFIQFLYPSSKQKSSKKVKEINLYWRDCVPTGIINRNGKDQLVAIEMDSDDPDPNKKLPTKKYYYIDDIRHLHFESGLIDQVRKEHTHNEKDEDYLSTNQEDEVQEDEVGVSSEEKEQTFEEVGGEQVSGVVDDEILDGDKIPPINIPTDTVDDSSEQEVEDSDEIDDAETEVDGDISYGDIFAIEEEKLNSLLMNMKVIIDNFHSGVSRSSAGTISYIGMLKNHKNTAQKQYEESLIEFEEVYSSYKEGKESKYNLDVKQYLENESQKILEEYGFVIREILNQISSIFNNDENIKDNQRELMSGYWVEAFNELKNNLASIKERNKKGKE